MKAQERKTVGARIIEGLEQAIAWTKGENDRVRVTLDSTPRRLRSGLALPLHPNASALRAFPLSLLVEDMPLLLFHRKSTFPAGHAIPLCP